jgi:hypothetical protein
MPEFDTSILFWISSDLLLQIAYSTQIDAVLKETDARKALPA